VKSLIIGLLLFALPVEASGLLQWNASLAGRSTDDSFSSTKTVGLAFRLRAKKNLSQALWLKFQGGAILETGSSSTLFTNEFEPKSRLKLEEASFNSRFSIAQFSLGALRHSLSPLVLKGGTFPSAYGALLPVWGNLYSKLELQGSIPTSNTLSTRSTGKEPTPALFTTTGAFGWRDKNAQFAGLNLSYFQFNNLTRGIAQDSRFYGNSVTGIGAASRFPYQYAGFVGGPSALLAINNHHLVGAQLDFSQNDKGPRNSSRGLYGKIEYIYRDQDFAIRPQLEWYQNEGDSSPAFFSHEEFGHNNRKGFGGVVRVELKETKLNFELKYRKTNLIEANTFQRNTFTYGEILLEIPYASF